MTQDKIILPDTSKGDSRTSGGTPSLEEVYKATVQHVNDVMKLMEYMSEILIEKGKHHDHTKLENFETEYGKLVHSDVKNEDFLASKWWWEHITQERHHLDAYTPADVNLFDVLEMIADRVSAEKGRTGSINTNYMKLDKDTLLRAYWNTIILLDNKTIREE